MNRILTTKASHFDPRLLLRKRLHHYDHHILLWRRRQILDPNGSVVNLWNHIFLVNCILALFVDPLYFYLPYIGGDACFTTDVGLAYSVAFMRTGGDLLYITNILLKFRTAFVAPSSRVFGKGELVMDRHQIATRYLKSSFAVDVAAAFPLPQFVTWVVIPLSKSSSADYANNTLALLILIQFIPRLYLIFPLNKKIVKSTGLITRTAFLGAAYNLLLYILASHVIGAAWYLLSIGRQHSCWKETCDNQKNASAPCFYYYLDCKSLAQPDRSAWYDISNITGRCDAKNADSDFRFGIFGDAFKTKVATTKFFEKYLYCFWWGLRNLSCYGQNLETSIYVGETTFSSFICILGLFLFASLIGQMQQYLLAMTKRLQDWRVKRRDTEEWMQHRCLPFELRERVRRFVQYTWLATRGVEEEEVLQSLPIDLRREIQRHLCFQLVRRVPFFSKMDDQLLDAICERLVSSLSTKGTYVVREDDPVDEMLFIIRGQLESSTTNGGRSGFFNSITLRPGDFVGEELLTWALMPNSTLNLPSSTRTVKTLTEVEAFTLRAEDLKLVALRFKRLHSKKLQHAFRYYSHQWRTWAACFIQSAWRRYRKRNLAKTLAFQEGLYSSGYNDDFDDRDYDDKSDDGTDDKDNVKQGTTILGSKYGAKTKRKINYKGQVADPAPSLRRHKLLKPDEPDFSGSEDEA